MILYSIIALSGFFLNPALHRIMPVFWAKITATAVTLAVMSPFLKALIGWETVLPAFILNKASQIFCRLGFAPSKTGGGNPGESSAACSDYDRQIETVKHFFISNSKMAFLYHKLWNEKRSNRLPLLILTTIRLLILAAFIYTAGNQFLTPDPKIILPLTLITVLLLSQSRWLLNQYLKIETQFLENLKGDKNHPDSDSHSEKE